MSWSRLMDSADQERLFSVLPHTNWAESKTLKVTLPTMLLMGMLNSEVCPFATPSIQTWYRPGRLPSTAMEVLPLQMGFDFQVTVKAMGEQAFVVAVKRAMGLIPQSLLMVNLTHSDTGDLSAGVATAKNVSCPLLPLKVQVFPESLLQLY